MKIKKAGVLIVVLFTVIFLTSVSWGASENPAAWEIIYPGNVATGLSAGSLNGILGPASKIYVTVEDGALRFEFSGANPTNTTGTSADVGNLLLPGANLVLPGKIAVQQFRVIDAVSGARGRAHVTVFYGGE
jgi:hypothetical protein